MDVIKKQKKSFKKAHKGCQDYSEKNKKLTKNINKLEILNNNISQKEKTTPKYFLARSFVNHCSHFQAIINTTKLQSS